MQRFPLKLFLLPDCIRMGTVGKSYVGTENKILDPDASGYGEIAGCGRNIFMGYMWDEKKTDAATVESEGNVWYKTGDIGR